MTHTERDESRRTWAELHKPSRLEAASDRGYDGEPSHPAPAHQTLGDWEPLLGAAVREATDIRNAGEQAQDYADEREHDNWRGES